MLTCLLAALVTSTLAQCNAPDGFWEEYNAEAAKIKVAPAKPQAPSGGCSLNHDHSHDHSHSHGASANQAQTRQPESERNIGPDHKEYQEIIDQIERESHAHDDFTSDNTFFTEQAFVYLVSGLFGFAVLIPFWLPVLASVFGKNRPKPTPEDKEKVPEGEAQSTIRDRGWILPVKDSRIGVALAFQAHETLLEGEEVAVYQSKALGKVLTLNGVIQAAERDEFAFEELFAHIPMQAHSGKVGRVLILDAGDAGLLTQVLKYSSVTQVTLRGLHEGVVDAIKLHFPERAKALADSRVVVETTDNPENNSVYDVVLSEGPITKETFEKLTTQLSPDGILCAQMGSVWRQSDEITQLQNLFSNHFSNVKYASVLAPTRVFGQSGLVIASNAATELTKPNNQTRVDAMGLKWYTPALHSASFSLPKFVSNNQESVDDADSDWAEVQK